MTSESSSQQAWLRRSLNARLHIPHPSMLRARYSTLAYVVTMSLSSSLSSSRCPPRLLRCNPARSFHRAADFSTTTSALGTRLEHVRMTRNGEIGMSICEQAGRFASFDCARCAAANQRRMHRKLIEQRKHPVNHYNALTRFNDKGTSERGSGDERAHAIRHDWRR